MNPVSVGKDLPVDGDPVYPGAVPASQIFQDQRPVFPANDRVNPGHIRLFDPDVAIIVPTDDWIPARVYPALSLAGTTAKKTGPAGVSHPGESRGPGSIRGQANKSISMRTTLAPLVLTLGYDCTGIDELQFHRQIGMAGPMMALPELQTNFHGHFYVFGTVRLFF